MEINRQATMFAHKEILVQAPIDVVWKIQSDIASWKKWQPDIAVSNLGGPLAVGSVFRWKSGGIDLTSTIQVVEPKRQIGWTGKALGATASHLWKMESRENATLVTTEEAMDGWSISLMKVMMPKFLEGSLERWLDSLKTEAERRDNAK